MARLQTLTAKGVEGGWWRKGVKKGRGRMHCAAAAVRAKIGNIPNTKADSFLSVRQRQDTNHVHHAVRHFVSAKFVRYFWR